MSIITERHRNISSGWVFYKFILHLGLKAEYLATHRGFVHQATFGLDEYRHPFVVGRFSLGSGGRAGTCASGSTPRASLGMNSGSYGNGGNTRIELDVTAGEFLVGKLS